MSGKAFVKSVEKKVTAFAAAQAGVNGYVIKPFTADAIQEKLQLLGLVGVEA